MRTILCIFSGGDISSMRFIDQGWAQIDMSSRPRSRSSDSGTLAPVSQPSLHIFTPRMRILVQCARLKARTTIPDLAKQIGVDPSELIAIEEGRRFPSSRTLELLQNVLGVQLVPDNLSKLAKDDEAE